MSIADDIKHKIEKLPIDKQQDVLQYVEKLAEQKSKAGALFNPLGLASGDPSNLSLEEFKRLRREAWGDSTDRELDH